MRERWDPVNSSLYMTCKSWLSSLILPNLADRVELAHSVEGTHMHLGLVSELFTL